MSQRPSTAAKRPRPKWLWPPIAKGLGGLGWVQRIAVKCLKHIGQGSSETVVLFPTEQVTGLVERTPIIDRLPGSLIIDRRPGLLFELVGRQAEVCCIEACFI